MFKACMDILGESIGILDKNVFVGIMNIGLVESKRRNFNNRQKNTKFFMHTLLGHGTVSLPCAFDADTIGSVVVVTIFCAVSYFLYFSLLFFPSLLSSCHAALMCNCYCSIICCLILLMHHGKCRRWRQSMIMG